jgi:hypothetical protein
MLEALARKSTPYQQSEIFGIYVLVFEIHAENFQLCSHICIYTYAYTVCLPACLQVSGNEAVLSKSSHYLYAAWTWVTFLVSIRLAALALSHVHGQKGLRDMDRSVSTNKFYIQITQGGRANE